MRPVFLDNNRNDVIAFILGMIACVIICIAGWLIKRGG
jgi:hypothetical protein